MHLTRRLFLKSSGAVAAYMGVAPVESLGSNLLIQGAVDAPMPVTTGKTLVVIFLRGGIDGLSLVVPYGDPHYATHRPSLKIGRPGEDRGALDLDGHFGLNPQAAALMPLHESGMLAGLQAVGYSENSRSHFAEQDVWETGCIGNTVGKDGWLNRHLLTSEGHGPVRAVALGDELPRILRGDAPAFAVKGLEELNLPETRGNNGDAVAAALEHAYRARPEQHRDAAAELVASAGDATLEAIELVREVAAEPYESAATYPDTDLATKLASAARLIKANLGIEVIQIDYGGWDSHNNQGEAGGGSFGNRVKTVSEAMAAFSADLGEKMDDTLVLTLSDFGRTVRENGSRGTDHGWANAMLAMGGAVAARGNGAPRPVIADWPGLAPDQLWQNRDLAHTIDFRDVLAEVVGGHLGNPNLARIIPDHEHRPVGLI